MIEKSKGEPIRLGILISHAIQNQVPLYRKLAKDPRIELTVLYCTDFGIRAGYDPEFGMMVKWDLDLISGYRSVFLRNISLQPSVVTPWGFINPGILKTLKRENFDAILINAYNFFTYLIVYLVCWARRIPVLVRWESNRIRKRGKAKAYLRDLIVGYMARKANACLAIGTYTRQSYLDYGVSPKRIFMSPYTVDNDFFISRAQSFRNSRSVIRERWDLPTDATIFLYAAKLIPRKNPLDVVRAFEAMPDGALLCMAGDGQLRNILESYVLEKGMKSVRFLGFIGQNPLAELYAAADVFVLPSSYETWGLVVNEAMCFGLPIVCSDAVGAAPDLVINGQNGFVYRSGDVEGLREALTRLAKDEGLRTRFGRASLERIHRWTVDQSAEGIVAALQYVVENDRK